LWVLGIIPNRLHIRKESLLVKVREVKRALLTRQPLYMLYCKELKLNSNISNKFPSGVDSVLQEFEDVFPKEIPPGFLELYYPIGQPIGVIHKRPRRFKNKWRT